jgi:hypothetical protein
MSNLKVPARFVQVEVNMIKSQCSDCRNRKDMPNNMDSKCLKFGKCPDKYRLVSRNIRCPQRYG